MEAIKLDILIDQNGEARSVLDDLFLGFVKAGDSSEVAAKKVEKFEKSLKDATAKKEATDALKKLSDETKRTGDESGKAAPRVDMLTTAVKRFVAPTVALAAFKQTIEWADALDDLSKQTGIGTTALQKWDVVARANGDTLNQLTTAAQRLGADLQQGDKSVVSGLNKMGLSVEELLRMNPEDRFREVAIAIAGIKDPAEQAARAEDVLKRSGIDLIDTMKDIAAGAERDAPAFSDAWIEAGAAVGKNWDELIAKGKKLISWSFLATASFVQQIGRWRDALDEARGMRPPSGRTQLPGVAPPGMFNVPTPNLGDPLGGNSMAFIENQLTDATKKLISARLRTTSAMQTHPLLEQSAANLWSLGARGVAQTPGFGPVGFPGWAPIPKTDWQPPWAAYPGAPMMNAPGGGGGLMNFLRGSGGRFLGTGLGMLSGLLPGMSGQGSAVGGGIGGAIGGLSGVMKSLGGFASFLGPIGGIVGGLLGNLFKPSEAKKTQQARAGFLDQMGGFDELAKLAEGAGFNLDKMFSTRKVKDFEAEVAKLNKALQQQEEDALRLDNAMQKYGFSIADMGDKFQQTQITKGFKEMAEDFRVLIGAGADFNEVAKRMAPEFGSLIQTAIETGSTVPKELEPIIKKMIEMGVLTDRNGDKFTDLAQVPFAESLTEGFDRIVAAVDRLNESISGIVGNLNRVRDAAAGAGDAISNIPDTGRPGTPEDSPVMVSRGGFIRGVGDVQYFAGGGFIPRGTDTVPAMLTPGEVVLSRDMVKDLIARDQRYREGPTNIVMVGIPIQVSDEETVEKTLKEFPNRVHDGPIRIALTNLIKTVRSSRRERSA
jgi:hypothetical protein